MRDSNPSLARFAGRRPGGDHRTRQLYRRARSTTLAFTLFAVDELTGLIYATALVRPSRSVYEVDARSVRKKMKDKAFARGVNRDDVVAGAEALGIPLDEHIDFVIAAMRDAAVPGPGRHPRFR